MGKCTFLQSWIDDNKYAAWLKPDEGNKHEGHCIVCKKKKNLFYIQWRMRVVGSHLQSKDCFESPTGHYLWG